MTPQQILKIERQIVEALKTVRDPEIPLNIYDLGLIYEVDFEPAGSADSPEGVARIVMTLTAPNCPMADTLLGDIEREVGAIPGVSRVEVRVTFDPPWDKNMLTDEARLELGLL